MCHGEHYICKDDLFHLQSTGTNRAARIYLDKQLVSFKFAYLRYMMNTLHFVRDQQTKYILAQNDVMASAVATLGLTEFVEPPPTATYLILYDQSFDKLKTLLILNQCYVLAYFLSTNCACCFGSDRSCSLFLRTRS